MAHKHHILSTALLPENAVRLLSENGFSCDEIPFIRTEIKITEAIKEAVQLLATQKQFILFTSAQAVAAVISCLHTPPKDWKILCISGATKKAAGDYFGAAQIIATADEASSLAAQISAETIQEIIFFCGSKRLDTLPILLAAKGIRVTEYMVYTTQLTPEQTKQNYDAVLFFSPSGVESFFSRNTIGTNTILFSIGKTTAKALAERVGNPVIVSPVPDKNSIAQTVIDFYTHK